ncbi:hypothetical protein JIN84_02865 [Luteolibacter yonseiensis]|uniref:Uncharacterized protein n=1 Tax=Luteolibacter yonseiensis TaxID=1144680 RepID=A0A934VAM7_9BACT|nr:hypothetical protein [Luteolibacter yonseiensis]MBK1814539.1 hypothetical protein [Luteolibacter yonseiensis]
MTDLRSRGFSRALAISTAICATASSAFADASVDPVIGNPAPLSGWEFRLEPYGWLTAIDGSAGIDGLEARIDSAFSDILQKLDMYASLQFEARNGRWGILADGFYADLSASGAPPGPLYRSIEAGFKQFIGELTLSYSVHESDLALVDVYAGVRYNGISLDLGADPNETILNGSSDRTSGRIAEAIRKRGEQLVSARLAEFKAAATARREEIESEIREAIEDEADGSIRRDLVKELIKLRDTIPDRIVRLDPDQTAGAVEKQRVALARSAARLKIEELRASVDSSLKDRVANARERVKEAKEKLRNAIKRELEERLPADASADKSWVDPILGVRARWPLGEQFFLATQGDVGGFGVSSDITWRLQATVGCRFSETVSAEIGYRHLHTGYSDGAFTYDIAESGAFIGVDFRF